MTATTTAKPKATKPAPAAPKANEPKPPAPKPAPTPKAEPAKPMIGMARLVDAEWLPQFQAAGFATKVDRSDGKATITATRKQDGTYTVELVGDVKTNRVKQTVTVPEASKVKGIWGLWGHLVGLAGGDVTKGFVKGAKSA